jgi:hypothetical protein
LDREAQFSSMPAMRSAPPPNPRSTLGGSAGRLAAAFLAAAAAGGCHDASGKAERDGGSADGEAASGAGSTRLASDPAPSAAPDAGAPPPAPLPDEDLYPDTLEAQREALFRRMAASMRLTDAQLGAVRAIFGRSPALGQGNPAVAKYAMTRRRCREIRTEAGVFDQDKPQCGAPFMVPLYDPGAGQTEADARVCIDRYEFPGIPCEHPVVWATAREAAELCQAVGKRLCDAHEWEGACAGALHKPDDEYAFGKDRGASREIHNKARQITWAYGPKADHPRCATGSHKTDGCTAGGWRRCGSNTYPAGAFPGCASAFGVYDQHGNAAEHMNLPTKPEELASAGGMGLTEMKGSWFIFSGYEAHPDDCRWRAPDWHGSKVMDPRSHANYHLGFRCCKSL